MNRRRKKFIRADLQLKIIFICMFVTTLVLLINFQMTLAALWNISAEPAGTIERNLELIRLMLVKKFLISVGMAIPLTVSVGILYTFRFSGPIYRFRKYLEELVNGRWDEPCTLRKGDYLLDLRDSINEGVGVLRGHIRESYQVLQDTCKVLDEVNYTVDDNGRTRIQGLRERIAKLDEEWRKHFPSPESPESEPVQEIAAENNVPAAP